MRLLTVSVLLGIGWAGAATADWRPSIFEGESNRAIQGCAAKMTDDAWSCAFIRCEPDKRLGLYLDIPRVLSDGPITLAIDGRDFRLGLQSTRGPFGDAYRVAGAEAEMFAAFAAGKSLRIRQIGIKSGYDIIPLTGIGPALRKLNQFCTRR